MPAGSLFRRRGRRPGSSAVQTPDGERSPGSPASGTSVVDEALAGPARGGRTDPPIDLLGLGRGRIAAPPDPRR